MGPVCRATTTAVAACWGVEWRRHAARHASTLLKRVLPKVLVLVMVLNIVLELGVCAGSSRCAGSCAALLLTTGAHVSCARVKLGCSSSSRRREQRSIGYAHSSGAAAAAAAVVVVVVVVAVGGGACGNRGGHPACTRCGSSTAPVCPSRQHAGAVCHRLPQRRCKRPRRQRRQWVLGGLLRWQLGLHGRGDRSRVACHVRCVCSC